MGKPDVSYSKTNVELAGVKDLLSGVKDLLRQILEEKERRFE